MIRTGILFLLFMMSVPVSSLNAQIYTWTDEQKTVHFTEDLGNVPKMVRGKVRMIEEPSISSPARQSPTPSQAIPDAVVKSVPSMDAAPVNDSETYGGRTYEQWEAEFRKREADMTVVRNKIDETAASLNSYADDWDKQRTVFESYKALLGEFKAMKAEYLQQVENARKAGLQINIQQ